MNSRTTQVGTFCSTHVVLRMSLPKFQPVYCIFRSIRTLSWLFAPSKLHKGRAPVCIAEWPYCYSLYCTSHNSIISIYTNIILITHVTSCYQYLQNNSRLYVASPWYIETLTTIHGNMQGCCIESHFEQQRSNFQVLINDQSFGRTKANCLLVLARESFVLSPRYMQLPH